MRVKISRDGAHFSSSSIFLLLSFSLPGSSENVVECRYMHVACRSVYFFFIFLSLSCRELHLCSCEGI